MLLRYLLFERWLACCAGSEQRLRARAAEEKR
jgi:hypothetical protein